MRLEQRLTPQLIQSMAILQKPVADLEAYIDKALESNAALELAEPEATSTDDGTATIGESDTRTDPDANSFERLHSLTGAYDLESGERAPSRSHRAGSSDGRDAKMGAMANTAGRQIGLNEHLITQWALVEVDDAIRTAGDAIIDHIDSDGYLRVRLEDIATGVRRPIPVADLEQAIQHIQQLEPTGVGARDVVECLLLQLATQPGENTLERLLIERHLDDLARNRIPIVAKATGYSVAEINEAMKSMRSHLCLHPGYLIGDRSVPTIRPDVVVEYADTGDGLTVRLARGNMPKLRIREELVQLAKSKDNGKETRDFARKHVDDASALIDAVKFRQGRLIEVARMIVEQQRDFFDIGPEGLKVFRMSDLAEELGCDPSTISRTVADKYMQTPRGIHPLRYFFTGGTETQTGESMGWDRVKTRVAELIEAEDRKHPLNDDQVAELLMKEGIEISRRTVAKYRQQLDIPTARQRREF